MILQILCLTFLRILTLRLVNWNVTARTKKIIINPYISTKLAQDVVTMTEQAATDLWVLTNEKKESTEPIKLGSTLKQQAEVIYDLSPAPSGYPVSVFNELPRQHRVNIIRKRRKQLLGMGNKDLHLAKKVGQAAST
jgi:hypothetical protein